MQTTSLSSIVELQQQHSSSFSTPRCGSKEMPSTLMMSRISNLVHDTSSLRKTGSIPQLRELIRTNKEDGSQSSAHIFPSCSFTIPADEEQSIGIHCCINNSTKSGTTPARGTSRHSGTQTVGSVDSEPCHGATHGKKAEVLSSSCPSGHNHGPIRSLTPLAYSDTVPLSYSTDRKHQNAAHLGMMDPYPTTSETHSKNKIRNKYSTALPLRPCGPSQAAPLNPQQSLLAREVGNGPVIMAGVDHWREHHFPPPLTAQPFYYRAGEVKKHRASTPEKGRRVLSSSQSSRAPLQYWFTAELAQREKSSNHYTYPRQVSDTTSLGRVTEGHNSRVTSSNPAVVSARITSEQNNNKKSSDTVKCIAPFPAPSLQSLMPSLPTSTTTSTAPPDSGTSALPSPFAPLSRVLSIEKQISQTTPTVTHASSPPNGECSREDYFSAGDALLTRISDETDTPQHTLRVNEKKPTTIVDNHSEPTHHSHGATKTFILDVSGNASTVQSPLLSPSPLADEVVSSKESGTEKKEINEKGTVDREDHSSSRRLPADSQHHSPNECIPPMPSHKDASPSYGTGAEMVITPLNCDSLVGGHNEGKASFSEKETERRASTQTVQPTCSSLDGPSVCGKVIDTLRSPIRCTTDLISEQETETSIRNDEHREDPNCLHHLNNDDHQKTLLSNPISGASFDSTAARKRINEDKEPPNDQSVEEESCGGVENRPSSADTLLHPAIQLVDGVYVDGTPPPREACYYGFYPEDGEEEEAEENRLAHKEKEKMCGNSASIHMLGSAPLSSRTDGKVHETPIALTEAIETSQPMLDGERTSSVCVTPEGNGHGAVQHLAQRFAHEGLEENDDFMLTLENNPSPPSLFQTRVAASANPPSQAPSPFLEVMADMRREVAPHLMAQDNVPEEANEVVGREISIDTDDTVVPAEGVVGHLGNQQVEKESIQLRPPPSVSVHLDPHKDSVTDGVLSATNLLPIAVHVDQQYHPPSNHSISIHDERIQVQEDFNPLGEGDSAFANLPISLAPPSATALMSSSSFCAELTVDHDIEEDLVVTEVVASQVA